MLKILAGEFRSRALVSPPDADTTRPYIARVRESVLGMLHGWFEDASVLDLFAGVGTIGLEAISRGARHVVLVEQNKQICDLLRQNVAELGCADRAIIVQGDALAGTCLLRAERPVDLIFVDPPYSMMEDDVSRRRVIQQIERCRELMGDGGFVVLRSPSGPDDVDLTIAGFDGPEPHRYGKGMWVLLYAPSNVT